jgi:lipopolysaccharide/colanic/teichoic acid biosynthesis glycosyltransferase
MTPFQSFVKRSFDGVASAAGLVVLSPCFAVLCPLVKLSSPGPVFFRQPRVGRSGKPFTAFKFRTMYVGADKEGPVTTADDPRITPLGRCLRKFKLDELPQLWNVLLGRMSFVGPRPDVPGYADWLTGDDRTILDLRPGITGPATLYFRYEGELLAKVNGPKLFNDTVLWPIKVRMNLEYLRKWSFWKDIGYILITVLPPLNRLLKLVPDSPHELKDLLKR